VQFHLIKGSKIITKALFGKKLLKSSLEPAMVRFGMKHNNHVPLKIPVNYCTSIDSSQKYLVYSIETHIKI
jgi:hypothetical protein